MVVSVWIATARLAYLWNCLGRRRHKALISSLNISLEMGREDGIFGAVRLYAENKIAGQVGDAGDWGKLAESW